MWGLTSIIGGFPLNYRVQVGTVLFCQWLETVTQAQAFFAYDGTIPSIHAGTAQTDHTELCGCEAPALDSNSVNQNNQID